MVRIAFIALIAYAAGHPAWEGARPAALERPLTGFHQDINEVARNGMRALGTLDGARRMHYLVPLAEALHAGG